MRRPLAAASALAIFLVAGALLVGMVQNPGRFDPTSRSPQVRKRTVNRRNTVLARMRTVRFLEPAVAARAIASPLPLLDKKEVANGCEARGSRAPFFCDHLRYELEDTEVGAALGKTREERQRRLYSGGLTIRTTLDPKVQRAAQLAARVQARVPGLRALHVSEVGAVVGAHAGPGLLGVVVARRGDA